MITILITGGSGFIGSAVIRHLISDTDHKVINVDKLTYAANKESLSLFCENSRYYFEHADICDAKKISQILYRYQPDIVMNLAAESHVDKSIKKPNDFMKTNVVGVSNMLNCSLEYYDKCKNSSFNKNNFKFIHIS